MTPSVPLSAPAERDHLPLGRPEGSQRISLAGAVILRARAPDTDSPRPDRLGQQLAHLLKLRVRGGLVGIGASLTHDVGAEGCVRHVGTNVQDARQAVEGVEVLGEGLPPPRETFGQGRAGDVLHAFHGADQPFVPIGPSRGKTDPTVAHGDRGHPVPGGGRQIRIPGGLTVKVGVNVHEPRRHEQAVGVDLVSGLVGAPADFDDAPVGHANVGRPWGATGAVHDRSSPDHQIKHQTSSPRARAGWAIEICRRSEVPPRGSGNSNSH